ncbi:MAG: TetR/AcrR family transcriptional regulator [Myxococcales bacterium]|nr:TetR/AcrR family transcriptional regulator [Myxococcales bacterium]
MARTVDHARRAELAAQTFEILRRRGAGELSMSELADALGVKRPTLYFYFRDLGEVHEAVLEENQRRLRKFALERLSGVEHPLDLLRGAVRALGEFYRGRRDAAIVLGQVMAASGGRDLSRATARAKEFFAPVRDALIERLTAGVEEGVVAPCDPAQVVDLTLAAADGALLGRVLRDDDPEPVLDAIDALILAPLRVRAVKAAVLNKRRST